MHAVASPIFVHFRDLVTGRLPGFPDRRADDSLSGTRMLNRLSINTLLKCVISVMAIVVVVLLAAGAWESWGRLRAISRIATITEASGHMFTALHNLRIDRTSTFRAVNGDKQLSG